MFVTILGDIKGGKLCIIRVFCLKVLILLHFLVVKHSRKTMSRVALFKCVEWLGISFLVFFYLEGSIFYTICYCKSQMPSGDAVRQRAFSGLV